MAHDPKSENWLDGEGVEWRFLGEISLEQFDEKASRENRARNEPLDDTLVERYAAFMIEGSPFPPVIAYRGRGGKLVLIGGNHRLAAARRIKRPTFEAYEVLTQNAYVIDRLTRTNNLVEGLAPTLAEILDHGIELVRRHNRSIEEVAVALHIPTKRLGDAVRRTFTDERLASLGIAADRLALSTRERLHGVESNPVLKRAAETITRGALNTEHVNDLVKEIREKRSEAEQFAVIDEWDSKTEVRRGVEESRAGKARPQKAIREQLFRQLAALRKTLDSHPSYAELQLTTPEHRDVFDGETHQLIHRLGLIRGTSRRDISA